MTAKMAIILQAGTETHEGLARALHSLLYSKELREHGADVRLVFDGAGTGWLAEFHKAATPQAKGLGKLFDELKQEGVTYEVCDYCSGAFGVRDELSAYGEALSAQYLDHPSIAGLVEDGYQLLVL